VVIATGTFLDARIFVGEEVSPAAAAASARPFRARRADPRDRPRPGRLKTGTPPRLDGRTIDWARLEEQPSDGAWTMSALDDGGRTPAAALRDHPHQRRTHDIIRAASTARRLFAGAIEGRGPRYCPSIEDKVKRFGDRDGHQIFLEPEGLDDPRLPERHFDLAAGGRAARVRPQHPRARAGGDRPARLCGRI
jgi:tRNA uridine 5-carboxymethylaminomethyl modification enzyme